MKANDIQGINELYGAISGAAGNIIITAHIRPDGDAMGSSLAMMRYIRSIGRQAFIIFPDMYPENLGFMVRPSETGFIISAEDDFGQASALFGDAGLVICLDFNRIAENRCGRLASLVGDFGGPRVLIDHHPGPELERFSLAFSETEISSASELLFSILTGMPGIEGDAGKLPDGAGEALFTGMTTDTNNFANSVFPSTFRMASALLEAGIDRDGILQHLYNEYKENRLRILGKMLEEMTITDDGVAYMIMDRRTIGKFGIMEGETEGFVNLPLSVGKVRLSCFLKEDDGFLRVSLRSKKGVSANRCAAEFFNGGGHEQASGGRLYIPGDIRDISEAASYVERVTHIFMNRNNGQGI